MRAGVAVSAEAADAAYLFPFLLTKLGMARRSQIAAWTATVDADPPAQS